MTTQINNSAKFAQSLNSFVSTQNLSDANKAQELELRPALLNALNGFFKSRSELGRLLKEYRQLFPESSFDNLVAALGLARRSAYDILEDYAAVSVLPESIINASTGLKIDLAKKVNRPVLEKIIKLDAETGLGEKSQTEIAKVVGDLTAEFKAEKKANRKAKAKKEGKEEEDLSTAAGGNIRHSFVETFILAAKEMGWKQERAIDAITQAWGNVAKKRTTKKPVVSVKPVNTVPSAVQVGA